MSDANVENTHTDSKTEYYRRMRERILNQIGVSMDQELKEPILIRIASKVTSVAIGCLEQMEDAFGAEVWGYKVPPEVFAKFPPYEQRQLKKRAQKWGECRNKIKESGNNAIHDIVDCLNSVVFVEINTMEEMLKEIEDLKRQIETLTRNERKRR